MILPITGNWFKRPWNEMAMPSPWPHQKGTWTALQGYIWFDRASGHCETDVTSGRQFAGQVPWESLEGNQLWR